MYPAFPDLLRTVQQNLLRDVIPDLHTDYAREQATGLLLLIQHLLDSWDRALEAVREEHDDLRETLRQIAGGGGEAPANDRSLEAAGSAAGRGGQLIAETRELRAELARAIASAPDGSAALQLAEGFSARQLARESAAVAGVAPTWD
jgi:hypothetical protein